VTDGSLAARSAAFTHAQRFAPHDVLELQRYVMRRSVPPRREGDMKRGTVSIFSEDPLAQALTSSDAPQALFHRCARDCRFRWPDVTTRLEFRTPAGEVEEVHDLAQCPKCHSTCARILAEPWPRVYFGDPNEISDSGAWVLRDDPNAPGDGEKR
jgi:hypothetical protein